tara:strand:+ start:286 stop:543 length:258 start_codon:yes stop_codon:yes gene_type:complete
MQIKVYINDKEELTLLESNIMEVEDLLKVLYNSMIKHGLPKSYKLSAYVLEHDPNKTQKLVDYPLDYIIEKNKKGKTKATKRSNK